MRKQSKNTIRTPAPAAASATPPPRRAPRRHQLRRNLDAVQLAQVRLDVPGGHASGVERDDLLVEPREAPLVLGDQRRLEPTLATAGNRQLELAGVGEHRLRTHPVAVIALRLLRFLTEMHVHLGVQKSLRQRLL
jgi:hypothetical protein